MTYHYPSTLVPNSPSDFELQTNATGGAVLQTLLKRNATRVVVPWEVDGAPVVEIGSCAFLGCSRLETLVLPPTLETVASFAAFCGCRGLVSVALPPRLRSIGSFAFAECVNLREIELPEGVATLGNYAFSSCLSLVSVKIPASLTSLGRKICDNCPSLESFEVAAGSADFQSVDGVLLSSDGKTLYRYPCAKKNDAWAVPDGVEKIASNAFEGSRVRSLSFPKTLKTIEAFAFHRCENISELILPEGFTELASAAFFSLPSLRSLSLPSTLSTIPDGAFNDCDALERVVVPQDAKPVEAAAFGRSPQIAFAPRPASRQFDADDVIFTPDGKTLVSYPRAKKATRYVVPSTVERIAPDAFSQCSALSAITLPQGLKKIGARAFAGCSSLVSLTVPSAVEEIERCAFAGCASLVAINVDAANINFASVDGVLTSKDGKTLVAYPPGAALDAFHVPATVEIIGSCAFFDVQTLEKIYLPTGITKIGAQAFYQCAALSEVFFPATLQEIGSYAFFECASLKRLEIPASVGKIGSKAFAVEPISAASLSDLNARTSSRIEAERLNFRFDSAEARFPRRQEASLTLVVTAGSVAEKYARNAGLRFIAR
ncbi:MAG: leucine-rich repeat domain-containing protein [Thermoguttaceae bacterium]|nr:leucine-rich repeat domain-containing protein [Thermoguttaceae bacterium]